MKLSIVIPSRNGGSILQRHLPEVARQAQALTGGAEILIVDDASDYERDNTAQVAASAGAIVRLIASPTHRGFAGTCNLGARQAVGEFLLFLNNDMHLHDGCLQRLVALLTVRPDVFAVSPTIVNKAQQFVESTTRLVWRRGTLDLRFPGREGDPGPGADRERNVAYACGGAMLCRRDLFHSLGGFCDLLSPFYWEDAELGLRAWQAGLSSLETGAAFATHDHAQTIGARYSAREIRVIYERHRLLSIWLHLDDSIGWFSHLIWLPPRWLWSVLRGRPLGLALPQAMARWREVVAFRRNRRDNRREGCLWTAVREAGGTGWPE